MQSHYIVTIGKRAYDMYNICPRISIAMVICIVWLYIVVYRQYVSKLKIYVNMFTMNIRYKSLHMIITSSDDTTIFLVSRSDNGCCGTPTPTWIYLYLFRFQIIHHEFDETASIWACALSSCTSSLNSSSCENSANMCCFDDVLVSVEIVNCSIARSSCMRERSEEHIAMSMEWLTFCSDG